MGCKHCVKCHAFAWWDGHYCCTMRMSIMEYSPFGKFIAPLPIAFDANKCEDYDERENYDAEVHDYYGRYIDFLSEYYELPSTEDKEKMLEELGYIDLKRMKVINKKAIFSGVNKNTDINVYENPDDALKDAEKIVIHTNYVCDICPNNKEYINGGECHCSKIEK